jgi:polar amino acid transport system permease protein
VSSSAAPAQVQPEISETERWRRAYRAQRKRRSTAVAVASTVVAAVVLWLAITHTPGWHETQQTFFSGHQFAKSFPAVAKGLWLNVRILLISEAFILVIGLFVALLRTTQAAVSAPLRVIGALYVDIFRGCPLLVWLYLFAFGVPAMRLSWLPKDPIVWGTVAISLCYGSYVAEVFRAGIQSIHPSQQAAARSLGLTQRQTLRLVVLPQAVRAVLPPLLNDFVALQKDVGLISIVAGTSIDAIKAAQIDNYATFNFTPYVIAALLFIALAVPSAHIADAIGARMNSRQRAGAPV